MTQDGGEFSDETLSLLSRWYRLRKVGKCCPLIQSGCNLFTFEPTDPWNTRTRISLEQVREMVELAECRKPIQSESLAAKLKLG